MQNLNLKLIKALLGACLLAGQGFASAKAISLSESQTNTHCLFIEQLELTDLEGRKLPEFDWLTYQVQQALLPASHSFRLSEIRSTPLIYL